MKFGGTSVADAARVRVVCDIVRGRRDDRGRRPIVVVSAQGGVTNQLIDLARAAVERRLDTSALESRLRGLLADLDLPTDLLDEPIDDLQALLQGISLVGELTPRLLDRTMSYGERCSARIVAAALERAGVPARAVASYEAGLLTDSNHGQARVEPGSYGALSDYLRPLVEDGVVPVVTGFIAKDDRGYITTLGRGGSDYTAAILGAALGTDEIEIWTDVDGVMSADPRIVPDAAPLSEMSFEEAAELAYYGAKVIHPATIQPAVREDIPIRVLNTYRPERPGTLILRDVAPGSRGPRSIASKAGISLVHVRSLRMLLQHGFMARLFSVFDEHEVVIDMISTSEVTVTLSTDSDHDLAPVQAALAEFADVEVDPDKAILCIVGDGLRADDRVLSRIFGSLERAGIAARMVSVGASRINVSLLVDRAAEHAAVQTLHDEFFGSGAVG